MKFTDIAEFTTIGDWECTYSLSSFVHTIEEWVKESGLQMNPDFQRGHVWTQKQQSDFVEFILRGGKTGRVIYLNNPTWSSASHDRDFVCVDGLQRYTAIKAFLNDEIKVFDLYYSEYEDKLDKMRHRMNINVNNLTTKKEVLKWYLEMNTGGTPHSEEEIKRVTEMYMTETK